MRCLRLLPPPNTHTNTHTHRLKSFCLSWGVPCRLDLGGSQFTTSLPGSGKSGPGSILCLTPGGGVAPPNTPFPAARPGGGGAQILGAGRASVASPSRPPSAPASFPLPPSPAPQPPPVPQTAPIGWGPGPGAGSLNSPGSVLRGRPSWNKVLRPGAGLLPAADAPRAGSLQTQSEPGSRRESERARELDESPAQPPPGSLGSLNRPPTCPARPLSAGSGPSARTGHGARSGRSPGPPPLAGAAPALRSDLSSADRRAP